MEIRLYPNKSTELYKQLADQLLKIISDEHLKEGDQLPSVRQLATELKINPSTVQKSYQLLHEKGLILVEPKKRAIVSRYLPKDKVINNLTEQLNEITIEAKALRITKEELEFVFKQLLGEWEDS